MYGPYLFLILILISSVPIIVVYVWFRLAKYQFSQIRFLFTLLTGAAAFFPALIMQNLLNFSFHAGGRMQLFYHVFVRVAFTEELSRLLLLFVFFWISSRAAKDSISQPLSAATIRKAAATGLVAGLGFALLENAVYGASNPNVLLLRALTTAPLHAACGSRIGLAVIFRANPMQMFVRLLTATAIHGIYNFLAPIPGLPSIGAVFIALTALFSSILTIIGGREQTNASQAPEENPQINP